MGRLDHLILTLTDLRHLGLRFAWAALMRWRRPLPYAVAIEGVGDVWVRGRDSDLDTLRTVFIHRDYELPAAVQERLSTRYDAIRAAGKQPLIVDAGANTGMSALWFARLYPEAIILAVEPDPATLAMLDRNVERFPDIRVVRAAIGSEAGTVALEHGHASDATRTVRSDSGMQVTTFAELLASAPDAVPFIAKIDIEGFEADLFACNTGWIDDFYAIAVELHDWMLPGQRSSGSFQAAMAAHDGFEVFLKGENLIYVRLNA
ncbi:FkbM family methyltransferase [Sphingomonas sp. SUN039]|uniref:FkbM family methyltransferase n=1 Tax=Sphingomonas sp. SUN039 TaxID=2937787 RepID=UPI00216462A4|nr:FkbM family methyltransferase [Sphingomonas sp. SUN039]UVO53575.1 FkbM family methyltransferase [Sphingomonas sp. SUN039]